MTFKAKILITTLGIVGFDALTSLLSKRFQFDYTKLIWVSFLLYLVVGYWGAHRRGLIYGMLLGTWAGLVDSTVGWFVSRWIGPFFQTDVPTVRPLVVAIVVTVVTTSGFLLGSIGAVLCKLLGQTRAPDA